MKIAILSSHTKSLFWFRIDLIRELKRRGNDVIAIGQEKEKIWASKFIKEGVKYKSIKFDRNGLNPISDLIAFKNLIIFLYKEKPDRIFIYQSKPIVYGCIAAKIVGINGIYPLIAGLGSILRNAKSKYWLAYILKIQYKIALYFSNKVIFQNKDDLEMMINSNVVKRTKTKIINGSGVNMDVFVKKPFPDKISFLCIARIIKDKGIIEYIKAAQILKNNYREVKFVLVGPFDTNPSALKEEDLKPYIDNGTIIYLGESENVKKYYEDCSIFVLPSYHEGTPKTVLEAMATCRPVITTNAPGCRETVINGVTGLLVKVGDIKDLTEKMEYLLNHKDICIKMGEAGYKYCMEKFNVNDINKNIIKIIGAYLQ